MLLNLYNFFLISRNDEQKDIRPSLGFLISQFTKLASIDRREEGPLKEGSWKATTSLY